MAKKPKGDKSPEKPKRETRDFSQRAHDLVREVEKRHADRHKGDPAD
jgi:hypothetical protein